MYGILGVTGNAGVEPYFDGWLPYFCPLDANSLMSATNWTSRIVITVKDRILGGWRQPSRPAKRARMLHVVLGSAHGS